MTTVTDFLQDKQQEIAKRLAELQPTVEEYRRLEAAEAALGAIPTAPEPSETARSTGRRKRGPGRPRGSGKHDDTSAAAIVKTAATKPVRRKARRGRRKGTGKRSAEALTLIQSQPGVTIPELAVKMGISSTYLYRLLPALQAEGKIRKDGRAWQPVGD
jgi:hypothetical protein